MIVSDAFCSVEVPEKPSFCGLDEDMMRRMYNRLKYGFFIGRGWCYDKQPKSYHDLVIVSSAWKSNKELKQERQAILALESLGRVIQIEPDVWQTVDYDETK